MDYRNNLNRRDIYETVIVPAGRAIKDAYYIPPGYSHEFIETTWIGAQKVDIYHILREQGDKHEEKTNA